MNKTVKETYVRRINNNFRKIVVIKKLTRLCLAHTIEKLNLLSNFYTVHGSYKLYLEKKKNYAVRNIRVCKEMLVYNFRNQIHTIIFTIY